MSGKGRDRMSGRYYGRVDFTEWGSKPDRLTDILFDFLAEVINDKVVKK